MRLKHKICLLFIASTLLAFPLCAQHYLTAAIGLAGSSVSSEKMDSFRETYNEANKFVLKEKLDGFTFGVALRTHLAYRYISNWNTALLIGYQKFNDFDIANFSDGSRRKIALQTSAFFAEYEWGYTWGEFFSNGLLCFYFNRIVQIKNTYNSSDPDYLSSFSDTFKGSESFSTDIGVALGFIKKPFFIVLKVSYPLYTGGDGDILTDARQDAALKKFPADYFKYSQNEPYPGVPGNLDGMKFILTLSYAFKLEL